MSSKTRSSQYAPTPAGKNGKPGARNTKPAAGNALSPSGGEINLRFHKYFTNIMIPVIGVLALLSLIPQLNSSDAHDVYYWIRLVYNSVCIALCLIAFPGMRNMSAKGLKATLALLAVNAVYSAAMVVYYIAMTPDKWQAAVAGVSVLLFGFLIPYYNKRKKLFTD